MTVMTMMVTSLNGAALMQRKRDPFLINRVAEVLSIGVVGG